MKVLISKYNPLEDLESLNNKSLYYKVKEHLAIVDSEEWGEDKKVQFATYLRTDIDNLVLTMEGLTAGERKIAVVSDAPIFVLEGGVYESILNDVSLVCGKSLIDRAFRVKTEEALERLVKNSTCYPVGVYMTSDSYIIVSNVIISANLLTDTEISLNNGFTFHPIETLKLSDSLQNEISKSLVLVKNKEENK